MPVNSIISLSLNTFTPHQLVYICVNYDVFNPIILAKIVIFVIWKSGKILSFICPLHLIYVETVKEMLRA